HAVAEPFTQPNSIRVELIPGQGEPILFTGHGDQPDGLSTRMATFQRIWRVSHTARPLLPGPKCVFSAPSRPAAPVAYRQPGSIVLTGLPPVRAPRVLTEEENIAFYEHVLIARPEISPQQVDALVEDLTKTIK